MAIHLGVCGRIDQHWWRRWLVGMEAKQARPTIVSTLHYGLQCRQIKGRVVGRRWVIGRGRQRVQWDWSECLAAGPFSDLLLKEVLELACVGPGGRRDCNIGGEPKVEPGWSWIRSCRRRSGACEENRSVVSKECQRKLQQCGNRRVMSNPPPTAR